MEDCGNDGGAQVSPLSLFSPLRELPAWASGTAQPRPRTFMGLRHELSLFIRTPSSNEDPTHKLTLPLRLLQFRLFGSRKWRSLRLPQSTPGVVVPEAKPGCAAACGPERCWGRPGWLWADATLSCFALPCVSPRYGLLGEAHSCGGAYMELRRELSRSSP